MTPATYTSEAGGHGVVVLNSRQYPDGSFWFGITFPHEDFLKKFPRQTVAFSCAQRTIAVPYTILARWLPLLSRTGSHGHHPGHYNLKVVLTDRHAFLLTQFRDALNLSPFLI